MPPPIVLPPSLLKTSEPHVGAGAEAHADMPLPPPLAQGGWGSPSVTLVPLGFPGGAAVKNPPASAGDSSSVLGSGRSPGEGNGNPLQYSCLGESHEQRSLAGYSS